MNIARALIGDRDIETKIIGIRPGEKIHEMMISEEEGFRAYDRGDFYAIKPMLPELIRPESGAPLGRAYSSNDELLDLDGTRELLSRHGLLIEQVADGGHGGELLR
jgi:UDP-glucose 4-epimerase